MIRSPSRLRPSQCKSLLKYVCHWPVHLLANLLYFVTCMSYTVPCHTTWAATVVFPSVLAET
jgi:hypothetical protein